jgi:hypothetical protein
VRDSLAEFRIDYLPDSGDDLRHSFYIGLSGVKIQSGIGISKVGRPWAIGYAGRSTQPDHHAALECIIPRPEF